MEQKKGLFITETKNFRFVAVTYPGIKLVELNLSPLELSVCGENFYRDSPMVYIDKNELEVIISDLNSILENLEV